MSTSRKTSREVPAPAGPNPQRPDGFGTISAESIRAFLEGPSLVDGKQTWELAAEKKHDLGFMLRCCQAELETMARGAVVAAPYYFERSAIMLRKERRYAQEIELCERYVAAVERYYVKISEKYVADVRKGPRFKAIVTRIAKARALLIRREANSEPLTPRAPTDQPDRRELQKDRSGA